MEMKTAGYWINHLGLSRHPEGGYYRETYRSQETVRAGALPDRFAGDRSFSTSIYFLLPSAERSHFHRIKSDEIWYFHAGSSLTLSMLDDRGLTEYKLGPNPASGEALQSVVPAGCWFGARVNDPDTFTLVGCSVSPGFDFHDFELARRSELLGEFPAQRKIIEVLTKE
jgi:uncharacterized protein